MQKSEATRSAMDVSTSGGCSPSIVLTKSYNDDDDEMMMMICVPCNKWNRSLNLWMVGQIGDVFQTSLHLFVVIIKITHNGERIIVIIIIKIILLPPTENDEQRWFQPLPPEVSPLLGKTAPSVWMKVINIKRDPWGGILVLSSKHPCPPSTSVGLEVLLKFFGILQTLLFPLYSLPPLTSFGHKLNQTFPLATSWILKLWGSLQDWSMQKKKETSQWEPCTMEGNRTSNFVKVQLFTVADSKCRISSS